MSEASGPVRPESRVRRPARPTTAGTPTDEPDLPVRAPGDLQDAFSALARRVKLPTGPDDHPTDVLRTADLPQLMASLVADAQAAGPAPNPVPEPVVPVPQSAPVRTPSARPRTARPAAPAPAPKARPAAPPAGARTPPAGAAAPRSTARATGTVTPGPPATPRRPTPPAPARARGHVVRSGETLTAIARTHGVTVADLLVANGLRPETLIHPGDRLRLPGPPATSATPAATGPAPTGPATTPPPAPGTAPHSGVSGVRGVSGTSGTSATASSAARVHVVRAGDSLIGVARAHGVALPDLLELNRLHRQSAIHPGDRLRLPAAPGPDRRYPPAVTAAADANRAALARTPVPSPEQVKGMVVSTARSMGVDPALALGVAYLESAFQQRVVSPANAVGVMQVTPSSGRWASDVVGRPLDVMDARDNIAAGIALLRALTHSADSEAQAVAGYYQGLASVRRHGMFDDTRRYVANVRTLQARFTPRG